MVDRNDHYVPDRNADGEKLISGEVRPRNVVLVEEYIEGIGRTHVARHIAFGLADELNRGPKHQWWADYSDATEDGGAHWSAFNGHRVLVDIDVRQANERDVNDWKGRDEIRGRTVAKVRFDGQPVWEAIGQLPNLLVTLSRDIPKLLGMDWLVCHVKGDTSLVGRQVYYRDQPATIERFIGEQGCAILAADAGQFTRAPWDEIGFTDEATAKARLLDPNIWWYR